MPADRIVIVGGGVVGSSIAWHLFDRGFPGEVTVLERDPSYRRASSFLAMGGVRQQFSSAANIRLAQHSIGFYERFDDVLRVPEHRPRAWFRQRGYLFLVDAAHAERFERRYARQRALGARVERLEVEAIRSRVPDLALDDIRFGVFGPARRVREPARGAGRLPPRRRCRRRHLRDGRGDAGRDRARPRQRRDPRRRPHARGAGRRQRSGPLRRNARGARRRRPAGHAGATAPLPMRAPAPLAAPFPGRRRSRRRALAPRRPARPRGSGSDRRRVHQSRRAPRRELHLRPGFAGPPSSARRSSPACPRSRRRSWSRPGPGCTR